MSSMTIDQLKKSLTEQGITLPPSRSKKADYVKLYKQYSTMNDSLGDVYSSDDENPPRNSSQNVTSSSSPGKSGDVAKEVEMLSDEELYLRLKEFDDKIGPVLKNTRRVYEKKLIKMLTGGKQTNGYESTKSQQEKYVAADEFSDNEVEIVTRRTDTKGRKSSVLRESPKPSLPETHKPEIEKSFSSSYEYTNRSSTPGFSNETKSSRFSYIETIPKGSTYSYIEPDTEVGFSSDLRQRFTDRYDGDKYSTDRFGSDKYSTNRSSTDDIYKPNIGFKEQFKPSISSQFKSSLGGGDYKSGLGTSSQYKPGLGTSSQYKSGGFGDHYSGSWEPNISKYLGPGAQKKVSADTKGYNFGAWFKKFLAALLLLAILILLIYIYQQWSSTDPYKMIEDDAERTILEFEGSGN